MTVSPDADADADAAQGPAQQGGDPACWAHLVCPTCGRIPAGEPGPVCDACGATLGDD